MNKQDKHNINYFKKTETLKFVGGGVLIAGLLLLWLGFSWFSYIAAIIAILSGLVLFFIGATGRSSEADIQAQIDSKMAGLDISFIDSDRSYQQKLLKHVNDATIEGYRFSDDVMIKKTKSGLTRTSLFSRSKIKILNDRICIQNREISLISDNIENNFYEIKYDSLKLIEIRREHLRISFNKNLFTVISCYLYICYDGKEIYLPIADAVTSDNLVEIITRQAKLYRDQKA